MKVLVQLVDGESGQRSEFFVSERDSLAVDLKAVMGEIPEMGDQYILVVMEQRGEEWTISRAPLLLLKRFIEEFGG